MSKAIIEAVKELLRLVVIGIIGVAIAYVADLPQGETVAITLAVLRTADKWVHENDSRFKGLVPF